jgi:hypothetical protein
MLNDFSHWPAVPYCGLVILFMVVIFTYPQCNRLFDLPDYVCNYFFLARRKHGSLKEYTGGNRSRSAL